MGTAGRIKPRSLESMETACPILEDKALHPFAFRTHTHELGKWFFFSLCFAYFAQYITHFVLILGVRVTGYRVRRKNGHDHWTLIGERNPMDPQMFYEVEYPIIIQKGDVVVSRNTHFCALILRTYVIILFVYRQLLVKWMHQKEIVWHVRGKFCDEECSKKIIDYVLTYLYYRATSEDEMCNFYMMYWVEDTDPLEQQYCFTPGPPFYYWKEKLNNIPEIEIIPYKRTET